MDKPTPQQIASAAGVSEAFARMILADTRNPSLDNALKIFDETGWKSGALTNLDKRGIEAMRQFNRDEIEKKKARAA